MLGTLLGVGSSITNPQNVVQEYFNAWIEEDYAKMFSCLNLEKTEFLNPETFEKYLQTTGKYLGQHLSSFEVKEDSARQS